MSKVFWWWWTMNQRNRISFSFLCLYFIYSSSSLWSTLPLRNGFFNLTRSVEDDVVTIPLVSYELPSSIVLVNKGLLIDSEYD